MAKILLVEDDENLIESYTILLHKEGYEVAHAGNGAEGLQVAAEFKPDLILLDMLMPQSTGLDFLKEYGHTDHDTTKIIVISNMSMMQVEQEAARLGAGLYVTKSSMSPKELAELIRRELSD